MVAVHCADRALDVAVAAELGALLHAHRSIVDPRWRFEAVVRVRALARRFDVAAPSLATELASAIEHALCPQALRVPLGRLAWDAPADAGARAVAALHSRSWLDAGRDGIAAALLAGNRTAATELRVRVLAASRCRLPVLDAMLERGYVPSPRGWPELVANLARPGSEDDFRPSARLVVGLVDTICATGDSSRVAAAERLAARVARAERSLARAQLARLALHFDSAAAALAETRAIREDSLRAGARFLLALTEPALAEHIESRLLRQLAWCEIARGLIIGGRAVEGLRLLPRVDEPRLRAHRRLVQDELHVAYVPERELCDAFVPAPWLADAVIDAKTRRQISLATEMLRSGLCGDHPNVIAHAAWCLRGVASARARGAVLDRMERAGIDLERGLLALCATRPACTAPLLVAHVERRAARLHRLAQAQTVPAIRRPTASALERALYDEGIALSPTASQRRRVLIDACRATIRTALRSPTTVPADIVDARLRTLVHLGGELAVTAIANALDVASTCEHTERAIDALCQLDAARAAAFVIEHAHVLRGRCSVARLLQGAEVRGGVVRGFVEAYRFALVRLSQHQRDGHAWLGRLAAIWLARRGTQIDVTVLRWISQQPQLPHDPAELVDGLERQRACSGLHIAALDERAADPAWLAREHLLRPARVDERMPAWSDERWTEQLDLAARTGELVPAVVARCARVLQRPATALLAGELGTGTEATFVAAGVTYRVRLLDKRADLMTYLRFADVPARSCYRSDSDTYRCDCHGTQYDVIGTWKDPLSFCLRIERLQRDGYHPRGFFHGSFAAVRGMPAVVMNGLHMKPQSAAVRFPVIEFLEREICAPLGISVIGIANVYNGTGPLPEAYRERCIPLERFRAVCIARRPGVSDDIGAKPNTRSDANPMYWRGPADHIEQEPASSMRP